MLFSKRLRAGALWWINIEVGRVLISPSLGIPTFRGPEQSNLQLEGHWGNEQTLPRYVLKPKTRQRHGCRKPPNPKPETLKPELPSAFPAGTILYPDILF